MNSDVSNALISMPLSCVSCDHFTHKGRKKDVACPHRGEFATFSNARYGHCELNDVDVYGTQLCNSHAYPADLMAVHEVTVRAKPMEPFQEVITMF